MVPSPRDIHGSQDVPVLLFGLRVQYPEWSESGLECYVYGVYVDFCSKGISNFGTLIIQGFGFSTLVTTLMQIPYGSLKLYI